MNHSLDDGSSSWLPPGWVKAMDPNTGRWYYANQQTGESSWYAPAPPPPIVNLPPPPPAFGQSPISNLTFTPASTITTAATSYTPIYIQQQQQYEQQQYPQQPNSYPQVSYDVHNNHPHALNPNGAPAIQSTALQCVQPTATFAPLPSNQWIRSQQQQQQQQPQQNSFVSIIGSTSNPNSITAQNVAPETLNVGSNSNNLINSGKNIVPALSSTPDSTVFPVIQARIFMDQMKVLDQNKQTTDGTSGLSLMDEDAMKTTELSAFSAGQIADLCKIHYEHRQTEEQAKQQQQQQENDGSKDETQLMIATTMNLYYEPIDPHRVDPTSKRPFTEVGRIETRLHALYDKLQRIK